MSYEAYRKRLLRQQSKLTDLRDEAEKAWREFNRVKDDWEPDARIKREVELQHRLIQIEQRLSDIELNL